MNSLGLMMIDCERILGGKEMEDYIKRLLIACIMGACVSLLFLGGKNVQASMGEQIGVIQGVSNSIIRIDIMR